MLEYASIVWDNCAKYEKELLDKIQLDAARIVTGLTRSTKITLLLKEIGWVSLDDRRNIQKLVLVYKHNKGALPQYLKDIFPATTDNIPFFCYVIVATMQQLPADLRFTQIQLCLRLLSYGTILTSIQGLYQRFLVLKVQ